MIETYWTQQRIDALIYQDHERNHHPPDPECWYCQNERAEAMADSTDTASIPNRPKEG